MNFKVWRVCINNFKVLLWVLSYPISYAFPSLKQQTFSIRQSMRMAHGVIRNTRFGKMFHGQKLRSGIWSGSWRKFAVLKQKGRADSRPEPGGGRALRWKPRARCRRTKGRRCPRRARGAGPRRWGRCRTSGLLHCMAIAKMFQDPQRLELM